MAKTLSSSSAIEKFKIRGRAMSLKVLCMMVYSLLKCIRPKPSLSTSTGLRVTKLSGRRKLSVLVNVKSLKRSSSSEVHFQTSRSALRRTQLRFKSTTISMLQPSSSDSKCNTDKVKWLSRMISTNRSKRNMRTMRKTTATNSVKLIRAGASRRNKLSRR